ncbi:MAG: TIR domain-containing protein [Phycisphaerales bacterium]|nr:MAG: TIR domain-containing protein [Phycisphaerales bacterium]
MVDEDYKYDIFISYSHSDGDWVREWLLPRLENADLKVCIDYRDFEIGAPSPVNMEQAVERSRHVLLILTPNWIESEWTDFEALLIQTSDPVGVRKRVLPLMLQDCELPKRIAILTYADFRSEDNWDAELARLLGQIGGLKTENPIKLAAPEDISLAKLPSTSPLLLGREDELAVLDEAWADRKTNVVTFVAFGGVGKTALVNKWLLHMAQDDFRGAQLVYGWSFYSQDTSEDNQASGDEFIADALARFGDPDPREGSPWGKGERLARLVRKKRTLLILDGLEPLQYPPGEQGGCLRDPGVQSLLRELAIANPGLCVVSTRLPVDDLKGFTKDTLKNVNLEKLCNAAGAQLLRELGVAGSLAELEQTARDFGGHALALTLLGNYLKVVHSGDARKRDEVPKLTDERKQGGHARRVMESYERWFTGKPELNILRMLGLFDRPAVGGAIEALLAEPSIDNLTADLHGLVEGDWGYALDRLRAVGLLADLDANAPDTLDCHPLIREHFGDRVRNKSPDAWREGHDRLFEYFRGPGCVKERPDTLEEMAPLFAAVAHGCKAGRHREALEEVFKRRMQRSTKGKQDFHVNTLGAISADLAVLASFFVRPWDRPVTVEGFDGSFVLHWAGLRLTALGRLEEATRAIGIALTRYVERWDWYYAAQTARHLSRCYLMMGRFDLAHQSGKQGVKHALRCADPYKRVTTFSALGHIYHLMGRHAIGHTWFKRAERVQKTRDPEHPLLSRLQGYRFCELLLDLGDYSLVKERYQKTRSYGSEKRFVSASALNQTVYARALSMEPTESNADEAGRRLNQSVETMKRMGQADHQALGLLARAECYRVRGEREGGGDWFDQAVRDVDEAMLIATRGQMRLHECDCHLEHAHLHLAQSQKDEARKHFGIANKMVNEMGYHRRDKDLADLESRL